MTRRWLVVAVAGACLIAAVGALRMSSRFATVVGVYREDGSLGVRARVREYLELPNVSWNAASPGEVGLSSKALESLQVSLAAQGTSSLLVARRGQLALEWYAGDYGPNRREPLAAAAKGITASVVLLAALSDGLVGLDDRVASYVPEWQQDPWRSQVTLRHLASHSSGIEEVNFNAEHSGWKDVYFQNEDLRYGLALRAPILFEPGTRFSYAGVGYYVLTCVLGVALDRAPDATDVRAYLRSRVMSAVGIPSSAWSLNYGQIHEVDDMRLYAIGSGAEYTPRAVARIGQLLIQDGEWEGDRVLDATWVRQALTYAGSPPVREGVATDPPAGLGWWVNVDRFLPSLPEDAAVAFGTGEQVLLVVPSLQLVAVRLGAPLSRAGERPWRVAERELFEPLMAALDDSGTTSERTLRGRPD